MATRLVRDAQPDDAAACAALYAPYVLESAATFELAPPSVEEMGRRIAAAQERHAWLVLEDDGTVVGYAYGGPFNARPAYDWTCEVSIYMAVDRRGAGGGRRLYHGLLDRLAGRGLRIAVAKMSEPNEASAGLHKAMGFERVGTFRRVGWKFDSWHDVTWMQRDLAPGDHPPTITR